MRERPEPQLLLGDLPQTRQAVGFHDQEEHDQSAEQHGLELLAHALEQTTFFPDMVLSRFRTAGETGDVKSTSSQLADYYQMENQYAMKNLVSFIEVSISLIIMVALIFLTYLSSETATIRVDQYR